jgi:diacylglycerol kinase family enzyme
MGSRLCLDSGRLWVYLAKAASGRQLVGMAFKALVGLQGRKQFESICVTEVRIETQRSQLMVSFDGEFARMKSPLTYRIRPRGLRVLVP